MPSMINKDINRRNEKTQHVPVPQWSWKTDLVVTLVTTNIENKIIIKTECKGTVTVLSTYSKIVRGLV